MVKDLYILNRMCPTKTILYVQRRLFTHIVVFLIFRRSTMKENELPEDEFEDCCESHN